MEFNKIVYSPGDKLSASQVNHMQDAIEYAIEKATSVPTTSQRILLWDNATFHNNNQCADGTKVTVAEMGEEYSGVEVLFYCKRGGSLVSSGFIPKDSLNPNGAFALGVTANGELVTRTVRYSGNVFTFGAATIGTATDNAMMLPWRIYGFK